jgi:hypothetical protein
MALINCRECKERISDQAASCPHCGYLLQKTKTRIFETSQVGWQVYGQAELDGLLRDGWVIVDKNVIHDGYSGDGEEVKQLTYKLQKRG